MSAADVNNLSAEDLCWPLVRLAAVLVEIAQADRRVPPGDPSQDDVEADGGASKARGSEMAST